MSRQGITTHTSINRRVPIHKLSHDLFYIILMDVVQDAASRILQICRPLLSRAMEIGCADLQAHLQSVLWTPRVLCAVCTDWRTYCQETAALWSYISVPFIGGYFPSLAGVIEKNVSASILYSSKSQLRIVFFAFPTFKRMFQDEFTRASIQKMIWKQCHRWSSFRLIQSPLNTTTFWTEIADETPMLRRVHVSETAFIWWHPSSISDWSSVTHFHIDVRSDYRPILPTFDMISLTHFSISLNHHFSSYSNKRIKLPLYIYALSLMNGSRKLRRLSVRVPDRPWQGSLWRAYTDPDIDIRFSYPALEELILSGYDPRCPSWAPLLRLMDAPNTARIRIDQPHTAALAAAIASMKLIRLQVLSITMASDLLYTLPAELMSYAQDITEFSIYAYDTQRSPAVMDQLSDPAALPLMKCLRFGLRHTSIFCDRPDVPTTGFDTSYALCHLLECRHGVSRIDAAISCPRDELADLQWSLEKRGVQYSVWAFGESLPGSFLRNGEPILPVSMEDQYLIPPRQTF